MPGVDNARRPQGWALTTNEAGLVASALTANPEEPASSLNPRPTVYESRRQSSTLTHRA